MTSRLGVVGACGRLGQTVVRQARASGWDVSLTATSEGVVATDSPDVIVDASDAAAMPSVAKLCRTYDAALVEAVSALDKRHFRILDTLAETVPVILAPNLTFGHELQRRLLACVAAAIGPEWSLAVAERHPANKRDAPSATARSLARLCATLGLPAPAIVSVRRGPPVADHELVLTAAGEELIVRHQVGDLAAAARGALWAATWALEARPGLWTIDDVWAERRADPADREQGAFT